MTPGSKPDCSATRTSSPKLLSEGMDWSSGSYRHPQRGTTTSVVLQLMEKHTTTQKVRYKHVQSANTFSPSFLVLFSNCSSSDLYEYLPLNNLHVSNCEQSSTLVEGQQQSLHEDSHQNSEERSLPDQ